MAGDKPGDWRFNGQEPDHVGLSFANTQNTTENLAPSTEAGKLVRLTGGVCAAFVLDWLSKMVHGWSPLERGQAPNKFALGLMQTAYVRGIFSESDTDMDAALLRQRFKVYRTYRYENADFLERTQETLLNYKTLRAYIRLDGKDWAHILGYICFEDGGVQFFDPVFNIFGFKSKRGFAGGWFRGFLREKYPSASKVSLYLLM